MPDGGLERQLHLKHWMLDIRHETSERDYGVSNGQI